MLDNVPDTNRFASTATHLDGAVADEALVTDTRAGLTPAQMVERKLVSLLQQTPLPVGRLYAAAPRRPMA